MKIAKNDNILATLITKEAIYKLAQDSPILQQCIMAHEHSGLTWEGTLALMVYHLNDANKATNKVLIDHLQLCSSPYGRSM